MSDFTTTHVVPGEGVPTWAVPDSSSPPGPRLDPTLPVQLVEQQGPWARVICSNGWGAWVEGRLLVPVGATNASGPPHVAPGRPSPAGAADPWGTAVPPAAAAPGMWMPAGAPQAPASAGSWGGAPAGPVTAAYAPVTGGYPAAPGAYPPATGAYPMAPGAYPVPGTAARRPGRVRVVPALAAVAVFVSAFLPWLSKAGQSSSAMKAPVAFLFSDTTTATAGFAVGHLLLIVGALTLLGALIPNGAWLARLGGAAAAAIGILFVIQTQRLISSLGGGGAFSFLGAGVYVAVICGLLALVTTRRGPRPAPQRAGMPPMPMQPS